MSDQTPIAPPNTMPPKRIFTEITRFTGVARAQWAAILNTAVDRMLTLLPGQEPTNPAIVQVLGTVDTGIRFPDTQSVSGTVSLDPAALGKLDGAKTPATQTVSGSVSISNFPATQQVSGTLGVNGTFWPQTQPISGSVSVSNLPATQPVTGTFWPTTQPVSGTVSLDPTTQNALKPPTPPASVDLNQTTIDKIKPVSTVELGTTTQAALKPPTTIELGTTTQAAIKPPTTVELGTTTQNALKPPTLVGQNAVTGDAKIYWDLFLAALRANSIIDLSATTLQAMRDMMNKRVKKVVTTSASAWTSVYFTSDGTATGTALFTSGFDIINAYFTTPGNTTAMRQSIETEVVSATQLRVRAWRDAATVLLNTSSSTQIAASVTIVVDAAVVTTA